MINIIYINQKYILISRYVTETKRNVEKCLQEFIKNNSIDKNKFMNYLSTNRNQ
jgi:hypothetical protein